MGHCIECRTFSGNTKESVMVEEVSRYAKREGDAGGLYEGITFKKNRIFETEQEAYKWLNENRRTYENIGVQYKYYKTPETPSAARTKADERVKETYDKYIALSNIIHYKGTSSKFVGCRTCGSRLAGKYINSNYCPMCKSDLRPESTLKRIESLKASWSKALDNLFEVDTKEHKKMKYEICWLVQFEFHC